MTVQARAEAVRPRRLTLELSPRALVADLAVRAGIVAVIVFCALPIFWIALTSLKNREDVYSTRVFVDLTIQNFKTIFTEPTNFAPLLVNSLIVSSATVAIGVPIATMAAYAFSRIRFRGSTSMFIWFLATQFIPPVAIALPFFTLFQDLELLDTRTALVVVNLAIVVPYTIWLVKGFVDALPVDLEEAAFVDGCGELGAIRHVTFPLIAPGLIVSAVFAFVLAWNEFLFAFLLTRVDATTLTVGLLRTKGTEGVIWEQMAAVGMMIMVPILVLSIFIRRHFTEGLTLGAVK